MRARAGRSHAGVFGRLALLFVLCGLAALECAPATWAQDEAPVLRRTRPGEWVFEGNVHLLPGSILGAGGTRFTTNPNLREGRVIFPLIEGTSTHEPDLESLESKMVVNDTRLVDEEPTLLTDYQAGERLGRWDFEVDGVKELRLTLSLPMRTWEVVFDDARAQRIPWPTEKWPPIAASALQPQPFVESNDPVIRRLTERWIPGKAADHTPVRLAKILMAEVMDYAQPQGLTTGFGVQTREGADFGQIGNYEGLAVGGASFIARERQGSPHDYAALLCAVYRAAGIPSRLVIGYDVARSLGRQSGIVSLPDNCGNPENEPIPTHPVFRTWVEIFLLDEQDDYAQWIPVDIVKQREQASRAPAIDRAWRYFGNNECTDTTLPVSHHFIPPTTVISRGAPGLFGYIALPLDARIRQHLYFTAHQPVRRGGVDTREERRKAREAER